MRFLTGRHLPRRTFLRGAGASVALPLLDAMMPAGRGWRVPATDVTRLIAIEMVHGSAGAHEWGTQQFLWSPERIGRDFDLGPSALDILEGYRDQLTIISNTDVRMAEAFEVPEIGGDHPRSTAVFLTQAHPRRTESSAVYAGTSLDQLYAQRFGQGTPIPSMQLCIETVDGGGGCSYGYACQYMDAISWASATEPLPAIRDPRAAFDQLFGVGGTAAERAASRRTSKSILDWIAGDVARLQAQLYPEDRLRMDQYLGNVREIERRIQGIEARNTSGELREIPEAPPGVPDSFDEHVKLMFDLQVLAFQSDMTRVISFKMGRDASGRVFPDSGVLTPFHPASHHGNKPEAVLDFCKINRYHVGTLTHLLDKLKGSMEGDANLLDKTMIIYGSPMGDPNVHNHKRCPLIVLGGANGQLKGGLHLKAPDRTPMADAMLTLLHKLGMDDMESFGDSSAEFSFSDPSANEITTSAARG
jgi:hypothetical protein